MAEALSEEEVDEQLPDGWTHEGGEIGRTVEFDAYLSAIAFASVVGEIAETQQHYPEIHIGPEEVEVRLTGHDEEGITDVDIQMAQFFETEI